MTRSIASSVVAADSGSDQRRVGHRLGDGEHAAAKAEAPLVERVQMHGAEVHARGDAVGAQTRMERVARVRMNDTACSSAVVTMPPSPVVRFFVA